MDPPKPSKTAQISFLLDYVYGISKTPLNQSRLCHCDIESLIREQRFHLKPPPIPTHDGLPWYGFSKLTLPVYHPRSLLTLETYLFFRLQNFTTRQNFSRAPARTQAYEFAWTKHCPLQLFPSPSPPSKCPLVKRKRACSSLSFIRFSSQPTIAPASPPVKTIGNKFPIIELNLEPL